MKHIIGFSGGKDSTATAILAHILKKPTPELVYCKIMFDKQTSAEVPEHELFLQEVAFPKIKKDFGFEIVTVQSEKTYVELHNTPITKGPRKGMLRGSPTCKGCWVQRDLKLRPLSKYNKSQPEDSIYYVGIAKDEEDRLLSLAKVNKVSLLEECGFTEDDAFELCKQHGLLSPIYEFAPRNGCFFCPNAKEPEFRHLRDHHPDLWNRMLELERTPGVVKKTYNYDLTLDNIERNFDTEDRQFSIFDFLPEEQCSCCKNCNNLKEKRSE